MEEEKERERDRKQDSHPDFCCLFTQRFTFICGNSGFLEDRKLLWYQQMGSTCHDMRSCPPPPCHVTLSPGFKLARCFHEKPSYG